MSVLVVALAAEARPLIDALKLKRQLDKPWQYYNNGDQHLLLTGMGQLNAAAACAWLIGRYPKLDRAPWVNIGIAGHQSFDLGNLRWIERIETSKNSFYPALHIRSSIAGATLKTVDQPCSSYRGTHLIDMEGAAFYQTTTKFAAIELVHILKVVSDNRANPLSKLDKQSITQLIEPHVPSVLEFSASLTVLAQALPEAEPEGLEDCLQAYEKTWRFSHNQRQQLRKLQSRYFTLTQSLIHPSGFGNQPRDAKHALMLIDALLSEQPVSMP
ncbi:MAG: hypothetical protein ACPGSC_13700 [Granulosicoccaceae bacterium]